MIPFLLLLLVLILAYTFCLNKWSEGMYAVAMAMIDADECAKCDELLKDYDIRHGNWMPHRMYASWKKWVKP